MDDKDASAVLRQSVDVIPDGQALGYMLLGYYVLHSLREVKPGAFWRKKDGTNPVSLSPSHALVVEAGGIVKLITEWEPE